MPILTINKQYDDTQILTEAQLDAAFSSITTLVNTTGLGSDNIQDNSISSAELQDSCVTESKIAAEAVTTAKIADSAVVLAKLASSLQAYLTPTGAVASYSGNTAPAGWLLCDGSAVSRVTYADLFAAVGTRFGSGNGTTTFNVVDLRGRFVRGWDNTAARDPDSATRTAMNTGGATGDNIGSVQDDDVGFNKLRIGLNAGAGGGTVSVVGSSGASSGLLGLTSVSGTGTETRPKNAYLNFIIKT